uniref:Uncharacterized protein n=1 Tax=Arundo donax TaxID=35708 RepID=A0A0A9HJC5_ARUDO
MFNHASSHCAFRDKVQPNQKNKWYNGQANGIAKPTLKLRSILDPQSQRRTSCLKLLS